MGIFLRALVPTGVAAALLTGCAPGPGAQPEEVATVPATDWSTASYRYTLDSTCGERLFLGTYHVTVEHGQVTVVEAQDPARQVVDWYPGDVPTIADLLQRAQAEGLAAPSEFHLDPATGVPTVVKFEGDPNAIDDEECYAISDYAALR